MSYKLVRIHLWLHRFLQTYDLPTQWLNRQIRNKNFTISAVATFNTSQTLEIIADCFKSLLNLTSLNSLNISRRKSHCATDVVPANSSIFSSDSTSEAMYAMKVPGILANKFKKNQPLRIYSHRIFLREYTSSPFLSRYALKNARNVSTMPYE